MKQVLERLKTNGLQKKLKKCEFIKPSIRFLGHIISHGQVEKSQHLVEAIATAELPKTMRQLIGFMGLANYYRKFIKNFAKIASPLNKRLNNTDKNVLLSEDAQETFERLKKELTDMDNILSLPNFDLPFILETDASDYCIGAALMQKIEGKECPIAFYSRAMTVAEKNYDTSQKELLAIVKALEHFKQFLYGKEFIIKTYHQPLTAIKTKAKSSIRLGRWLNVLADYSFKIEHKKGTDNILADALSKLNLPAFEDEEPTRIEKIINSVGLQYESDVEIIEFHHMVKFEAQEGNLEEIPDPVELNSLEFFIKALSYFEKKANGKLSSSEPSPASLVRSETQRFDINAIKTALLDECKQFGTSHLLNDPISTPEESSNCLPGETNDDCSITNLAFCNLDVNNIVGTNSKFSSEYQMSDVNLRWLKEVIRQRDASNGRPKITRKGLIPTQKKLLKYLASFIILKDLIYFVEEDKFGNERHRYVMPNNARTRLQRDSRTFGYRQDDRKIEPRFFLINLSKDVKKFVKECFDCKKVKPPKTYCKPKFMPLGPTKTLMIVIMDMAGPLPETPRGNKYILAMCDHFTKHVKVFPMKGQTVKEVAENVWNIV